MKNNELQPRYMSNPVLRQPCFTITTRNVASNVVITGLDNFNGFVAFINYLDLHDYRVQRYINASSISFLPYPNHVQTIRVFGNMQNMNVSIDCNMITSINCATGKPASGGFILELTNTTGFDIDSFIESLPVCEEQSLLVLQNMTTEQKAILTAKNWSFV